MSLVLDGIQILELSTGISGPMATMLLADHGARVTRIERPFADPLRDQLGHHAWNRGKRSAVLDLKQAGDDLLRPWRADGPLFFGRRPPTDARCRHRHPSSAPARW